MKKLLSTIMVIVTLLSAAVPVYASEASSYSLEQMSVSEALSDSEIVNYLILCDELDDLYQAQEEIRNCQYDTTATYARETLGVTDVSASDVQFITEKYNLQLPSENTVGVFVKSLSMSASGNKQTYIKFQSITVLHKKLLNIIHGINLPLFKHQP